MMRRGRTRYVISVLRRGGCAIRAMRRCGAGSAAVIAVTARDVFAVMQRMRCYGRLAPGEYATRGLINVALHATGFEDVVT